jgi:hypothetical protein
MSCRFYLRRHEQQLSQADYLLRTRITVAAIRLLLVDKFDPPILAYLGSKTLQVRVQIIADTVSFEGPRSNFARQWVLVGLCTALYFASPTYPYEKILERGLLFVWCRVLPAASGPYFVLLCTSCYLLYLVFREVHFSSSLILRDHLV